MIKDKYKIAIIGLGYVGLPLAIEFSNFFPTVGYDNSVKRIKELKSGFDNTNETTRKLFHKNKNIVFTSNSNQLKSSNIYILTVPTPLDKKKKPDLSLIKSAIQTITKYLKKMTL